MNESIYVSREELYDQVWSTPTQHLAAKYGVSDVALGKICNKLSVPKPPPGYWARVAAGYKPKKTRLPKTRPNQDVGVTISPSPTLSTNDPLDSHTLELIESLRQREGILLRALERPHRLIRTARKHLRTGKPGQYGRVWSSEQCVDIRVSKASLNRGLLILNTIFQEVQTLGYQVYISTRESTVLEKNGTELTVALYERSNRRENPPPKKDAPWWHHHDRYSYEPSGELEIVLGRGPIGESRWKDTAERSLEDRIKDVLIGIVKSTYLVRREEARRAQADELRRQVAHEQAERRRIESEEQERSLELTGHTASWHTAEHLREFISVADVALRDLPELETHQIGSWISWAKEQADRLDPLINGSLVEQVRAHTAIKITPGNG